MIMIVAMMMMMLVIMVAMVVMAMVMRCEIGVKPWRIIGFYGRRDDFFRKARRTSGVWLLLIGWTSIVITAAIMLIIFVKRFRV